MPATLTAMARMCEGAEAAAFFVSARGKTDEALELHRAVAAAHVAGVPIDWSAYKARGARPGHAAGVPVRASAVLAPARRRRRGARLHDGLRHHPAHQFAHGEVVMIGAMVAFTVINALAPSACRRSPWC